jgi:hypothetical protein
MFAKLWWEVKATFDEREMRCEGSAITDEVLHAVEVEFQSADGRPVFCAEEIGCSAMFDNL